MEHQQPIEELPGFRYDARKHRYFRITQPGFAPYDVAAIADASNPPTGSANVSAISAPLSRYLMRRSLGLANHQSRLASSTPAEILSECRLAVWPPPAKCQQAPGTSVIVRRPVRLVPTLMCCSTRRSFSLKVHTGCSVDAVPGVSNGGGLLEESRIFRLRLGKHRKTARAELHQVCHRIFETKSPAAYSASVAFDLVSAPCQHSGCGLFAIVGFLGGEDRRVRLSILPRKTTLAEHGSEDSGDADLMSIFHRVSVSVGLRWPVRGGDRGDQLVDLRISNGSDFQTALAGRRATFCLPSLSSFPVSDLSPLCVADSPIVGLDSALLTSSSRLVGVCSLQELILADVRAGRVVATISAPSRHSQPHHLGVNGCNFTACRFLASASDLADPRLLVVDTPRAALLYDVRRPSVPLAVLSPNPAYNSAGEAVGHRASWLRVDPASGLVARADPGGFVSVWSVNGGVGCGGSLSPLLTVPPESGGLALPAFVDTESGAQPGQPTDAPIGLAVLCLPSQGGCSVSFWPVAY